MRLRVLLTVVALAGAPACADHATPALVALAGEAMGSTWSVRIVPAHQLTAADRADLERGIADIVSRVDALMSTWDTDSELSRFNAVRSRERVHVAPETFEVFEHARDLAHQTDGAIDVTRVVRHRRHRPTMPGRCVVCQRC